MVVGVVMGGGGGGVGGVEVAGLGFKDVDEDADV